ncbi:hypothetical protein J2750_000147 [Methanococcoides alaskense]|uniref:Uncharacterized protein n=1 Tax=Methanococcoides alaskense TaxID=325778 RepID=A0AA90TX61_9EURY|nr:hypothetical protein [Methanococcoides alaskense]
MEHPEHKFDGKVTNNIDMQEPEGDMVGSYLNIEKFHEWVLCLTLDDVREGGIEHRSTLKQLKDRVGEGGL